MLFKYLVPTFANMSHDNLLFHTQQIKAVAAKNLRSVAICHMVIEKNW